MEPGNSGGVEFIQTGARKTHGRGSNKLVTAWHTREMTA